MNLLKRYYEYPVLQEKIKTLEAANAKLQNELAEMSACRLSDIKSWNAAFDIERKAFLERQSQLESQLLRVFGLTAEETVVKDNTSSNKPQTTSTVNRPGSRSILRDEQAELKEIRSLESATDEELMETWLRMTGALDSELLDESRLDTDVGFKGR